MLQFTHIQRMAKLFQCNIEGQKHLVRIKDFIINYQPDIICLQEADPVMISILNDLGYQTEFLPIIKRQQQNSDIEEGVVLAAKTLHSSKAVYYYLPDNGLQVQNHARHRETTAHGYITGTVELRGSLYNITTTHFTWTQRGEIACQHQQSDMSALLNVLATEPSHILCGDMNIPRYFNPLYQKLTEYYVDAVPTDYKSSLDATYHRLGKILSRQHLFTNFMVDYVFTQAPYTASDVQLHFGLSDHAGITATIHSNPTPLSRF